MEKEIALLHDLLKESDNIVFFGGAGVSTESGIPDFRSATGLYSKRLSQNFSPEELVSHSFFERYPEEFFQFYRSRLICRDAKPKDVEIPRTVAIMARNSMTIPAGRRLLMPKRSSHAPLKVAACLRLWTE